MSSRLLLAATLTVLAGNAIARDESFEGFLCCNMRSDGSWISDINYAEAGKVIIPAGTPVKVTGYGRYRVKVEINGKKQVIGNDYSRDLENPVFAHRYVVAADPNATLTTWPARIQQAVKAARVSIGMTKEQVLMSVGYPITSENPDLDSKVWRYWISSFGEYHVVWTDDGKAVKEITTDQQTRNLVVAE